MSGRVKYSKDPRIKKICDPFLESPLTNFKNLNLFILPLSDQIYSHMIVGAYILLEKKVIRKNKQFIKYVY